MPLTKTNDIDTYYEIHGQGHPLLLISGLNCDHEILWPNIKEALAADNTVITYSPRGVAPTSAPDIRYSIEMMADDAAALLNKLGFSSANVLGYSMGGMIGAALAVRHPEKVDSLVLASTAARINTLNRLVCQSCQKIPRQEAQAVMVPWFFSNTFLTMFIEGKMSQPMPKLAPAAPQNPHGFLHQFEALAASDIRPILGSINTPTLIVAGEKDLLMPVEDAQELERLIPDSRLVVIPHAGHLLIHEQPALFLQMVTTFLKSTL